MSTTKMETVEEVLKNFFTGDRFCGQIDYKKSNPVDSLFVLRLNLCNVDDCSRFIKQLGIMTNTKWVRKSAVRSSATTETDKRVLFINWICQHGNGRSSQSRQSRRKKCTHCLASITIKVKLLTYNTRKKDAFLRLNPPLRGVVKANFKHNHSLQAAEVLRYLPLHDSVREKFMTYFDRGMSVRGAKRAHENELLVGENFAAALASGATNPSLGLVYRMRAEWRKRNLGSTPTFKPPLQLLMDCPHNDCPSSEFFQDLRSNALSSDFLPMTLISKTTDDQVDRLDCEENVEEKPNELVVQLDSDTDIEQKLVTIWEETLDDDFRKVEDEFARLMRMLRLQPSETMLKHLRIFSSAMSNVSTFQKALDVLIGAAAGASSGARSKNIHSRTKIGCLSCYETG